jgi:uroporphyrinogen decarboxylase
LFGQALPVLQKLIEKNIAIQFQNDIDILMIFDTEANQLTDQEFQNFCLPFIKHIADQYPNQIGYFTKNISPNKFELLKQISSLQLTVLGTQHNIFQELSQTHLSLQGNFSNDLLTIPEKSDFLSALGEYIDLCKSYDVSQRAGWIASLDHGVQKITPETNIHLFIDQIRTKLA